MDRGPDTATFDGWIALAFMPRDEEQDPVAGGYCALQRPIDRIPGAIEGMAMQVEHSVGLDASRSKATVPAAVERCVTNIFDPFWRKLRRPRWLDATRGLGRQRQRTGFNYGRISLIAR